MPAVIVLWSLVLQLQRQLITTWTWMTSWIEQAISNRLASLITLLLGLQVLSQAKLLWVL